MDKGNENVAMFHNNVEEWYGVLNDSGRAEVIKAKIAADAEIEQVRVKEVQQTQRERNKNDWVQTTHLAWRIAACTVVFFVAMGSLFLAFRAYDVQERASEAQANVETLRIEAEHPDAFRALASCKAMLAEERATCSAERVAEKK